MSSGKTILLIEDEPEQRNILQMMLENEGYSVLCADSGEEGLRHIEQSKPHLVISDVKLSGMDGFTLFEHVREQLQMKELPFIFSTGYNDPGTIREITKLNATAYITKPYDPLDLIAIIGKMVL